MVVAVFDLIFMKSIKYTGYKPASPEASAVGRGASRQKDTKPEQFLRRALWKAGLRYRKNDKKLPGKPDIVFKAARIAIFCDGDFWHGKDWNRQKLRLKDGHNSNYWVAKIEKNMERDDRNTKLLQEQNWKVLRFWESDIYSELNRIVEHIKQILHEK